MHKNTRTYWLEYGAQTSSGAYSGAILAWFCHVNEWLMLFWVMLFVALNALFSYLNRGNNTYEAIQKQVTEKMDALRFRGLYPVDRPATDEDVKRLKAAGEDDFAAVIYQTLHAVTPREARRAVKTL